MARTLLISLAAALALAINARAADSGATTAGLKPAYKAAYDFELPLAVGDGRISFSDLAATGKAFILVWWKSDCPHCQRELPSVQRLAQLAADGSLDLEVVSINLDRDPSGCVSFAERRRLAFPILSDPGADVTDCKFGVWNSGGTPYTCLFAPGGRYVGCLCSEQEEYVDKVIEQLKLVIHDREAENKAADSAGRSAGAAILRSAPGAQARPGP